MIKHLGLLVALTAIAHADPKTPDAKMAPPKPAAELVELSSGLAGSWKCTGTTTTDGKNKIPVTATVVNKSELDGWAMQTTFAATIGKETYKFIGYTTYNQIDKKFSRVMTDNMGGVETDWATSIDHGMAGKWGVNWEGESKLGVSMAGMPATMKARHTESVHDAGKTLDMTGQSSMDGGKTWIDVYTATCKK